MQARLVLLRLLLAGAVPWRAGAFPAAPRLLLGGACARSRAGGARCGLHSVRMQLEFPGNRREAQQSREYNVAKVRGGYYMSDKEGDAPLEEVITSKLADVGELAESETELQDDDAAFSQGMSDEEFAAFVRAQSQSAKDHAHKERKYMPSLHAEDPIVSELLRLGE